jgi:hypothetical protein
VKRPACITALAALAVLPAIAFAQQPQASPQSTSQFPAPEGYLISEETKTLAASRAATAASLAEIKRLEAVVRERDAKIKALDDEIAKLKAAPPKEPAEK